jgi:hypothetical protein
MTAGYLVYLPAHDLPNDGGVEIGVLSSLTIVSRRRREFAFHVGSFLIGVLPKFRQTQHPPDVPQVLKVYKRSVRLGFIEEMSHTMGRVVTGVAVIATNILACSRSARPAQYALLIFRQLCASSMNAAVHFRPYIVVGNARLLRTDKSEVAVFAVSMW